MSGRVDEVLEVLRRVLIVPIVRLGSALAATGRALGTATARHRWRLTAGAVLVACGYGLYRNPPIATATSGEVLVRSNQLNGSVMAFSGGTVLVLPKVHQVRHFSTRDQVYRLTEGASATGPAPFQSTEGLSIGVDLTIRWAIDRSRIAQLAKDYPDDLNADLVRPAVQDIAYPLFARHTVREIFTGRRADIQRELAAQLKPRLAAMGLVLRSVSMGQVDLPADYRAGMEKLLNEELETEKIGYTLQLKQAQVKQTLLDSEAAGAQQVIAAKAQEETMQHILPFKQKQIEQRQLEAEADKVSRIRMAEGAAEARRIEARGEADSRQKLADAEAYRLDLVGKATAGQMQREGVLITQYPLLIQKTLADKLSDKVQVIIAPTPAAGHFIGSNLLGDQPETKP
ncbi:MAG TPA: SPFH domain-containing protein [Steroidobacteraceae bacterium]|nr:SPFH domain-containing protein [Steroidobacteraceae bacterium]